MTNTRMKGIPQSPASFQGIVKKSLIGTPQAIFIFFALMCHLTLSRSLKSIPADFDSAVAVTAPLRGFVNTHDIPVFYNLFAANKSETFRVFNLALDQLSNRKSRHKSVYVHSIGYPLSIPNTTMTENHVNASEIVTLKALWQYCQAHPDKKVVYLHSKGSYHPSHENDIMRGLLTKGALSEQCANTLPDTCNVCSYRFAPFPHPHTPGNMWLGHCSYIKDLIDPARFRIDMEDVWDKLVTSPDTHGSCVGKGRWAAEHWVHSHPSVKPCDLYNNHNFGWGYDGLRKYKEGDFEFSIAPRYPLYDWPASCGFSDLSHRLKEYRLLYNMTPSEDWWGWNFWLGPHSEPIWPQRPRQKSQMNLPIQGTKNQQRK